MAKLRSDRNSIAPMSSFFLGTSRSILTIFSAASLVTPADVINILEASSVAQASQGQVEQSSDEISRVVNHKLREAVRAATHVIEAETPPRAHRRPRATMLNHA